MAGQTKRLVEEIRAQRRQLRRATDELVATGDLGRRIRSAPVPWLVGAGLVGLVAGRWFARPVVAAGRRRMKAAVGARASEALVSGLLATFGLGTRPGGDGATRRGPRAGADAHPASGPATPRTADPALSPPGRTS